MYEERLAIGTGLGSGCFVQNGSNTCNPSDSTNPNKRKRLTPFNLLTSVNGFNPSYSHSSYLDKLFS